MDAVIPKDAPVNVGAGGNHAGHQVQAGAAHRAREEAGDGGSVEERCAADQRDAIDVFSYEGCEGAVGSFYCGRLAQELDQARQELEALGLRVPTSLGDVNAKRLLVLWQEKCVRRAKVRNTRTQTWKTVTTWAASERLRKPSSGEVMLVSAALVAWESYRKLIDPQPLTYLPCAAGLSCTPTLGREGQASRTPTAGT